MKRLTTILMLPCVISCSSQTNKSAEPPLETGQNAPPIPGGEAAQPNASDAAIAGAHLPDASAQAPEAPPPVDLKNLNWKDALQLDGALSTSIGNVNHGQLEEGIPLPRMGPGFLRNPKRPNPKGYFATVEVIQSLVRAAQRVKKQFPVGRVLINDLSFKEGGKITHHGSHRAGRDVDTLFYLFDEDGKPVRSRGVSIGRDGVGWHFGKHSDPDDDVYYKFDVARTFAFLQALVEDKDNQLQRIFIAEHLRTLLMEYAETAKIRKATLQRIGDLTCQPNTPHDDHIHLRFFCSPQDLEKGCEDVYPVYPWQKMYLRSLGMEPVISAPKVTKKKRKKKKTIWMPELDPSAHERVVKFWEERKTWILPPRTGRPYCK